MTVTETLTQSRRTYIDTLRDLIAKRERSLAEPLHPALRMEFERDLLRLRGLLEKEGMA